MTSENIKWEHDCKTCLYNTEPKAGACEECRQNMVWTDKDKFVSVEEITTLSTDWVLVVRCKDCKNYVRHDHRCGRMNHGFKDYFFCAWGERREDGQTD